MNTTKYTYKQKVKTFSDSQLFGLEMTPYLNIQYPEWERGEEGSWEQEGGQTHPSSGLGWHAKPSTQHAPI